MRFHIGKEISTLNCAFAEDFRNEKRGYSPAETPLLSFTLIEDCQEERKGKIKLLVVRPRDMKF